jgi:hypothetical protein
METAAANWLRIPIGSFYYCPHVKRILEATVSLPVTISAFEEQDL